MVQLQGSQLQQGYTMQVSLSARGCPALSRLASQGAHGACRLGALPMARGDEGFARTMTLIVCELGARPVVHVCECRSQGTSMSPWGPSPWSSQCRPGPNSNPHHSPAQTRPPVPLPCTTAPTSSSSSQIYPVPATFTPRLSRFTVGRGQGLPCPAMLCHALQALMPKSTVCV